MTGSAQSQQPPQSQSPPAASEREYHQQLSPNVQDTSAPNQRTTPTPTIRACNPNSHSNQTQESEDQGTWSKRLPWILLLSNLAMAGGTLYLAWNAGRQVKFLGDYVRATDDMARATKNMAAAATKSADVAEKSLHGLERPHLFVQTIEPEFGPESFERWMTSPTTCDIPIVGYRITNYGRGPAIIKSRQNSFRYLAQLPDHPQFDSGDIVDPGTVIVDPVVHGVVAPGTPSNPFRVMFEGTLNFHSFFKGRTRRLPNGLYVYGVVTYEDIFGATYRSGFCFKFFLDPASETLGFHWAGGDAYRQHT
jgi:hypothetical protein